MERQMNMARQMIDFQKTTFDTVMNTVFTFWNQTEQMVNAIVGQAAWVPEEGKTVLKKCMDGNKQACEFFKNAVDSGYNNLEKFLSDRTSTTKYGY